MGSIREIVESPQKQIFLKVGGVTNSLQGSKSMRLSQAGFSNLEGNASLYINSATYSWYFIIEFSSFLILKFKTTLEEQINKVQSQTHVGDGQGGPFSMDNSHNQTSFNAFEADPSPHLETFMKSSSDLINRSFTSFVTLQQVIEWSTKDRNSSQIDYTIFHVICIIRDFNEQVRIQYTYLKY